MFIVPSHKMPFLGSQKAEKKLILGEEKNHFNLNNSNSFTFASNLALGSWSGPPFIIFNDIFITVAKHSIDANKIVYM